jgi:hypothetical protein
MEEEQRRHLGKVPYLGQVEYLHFVFCSAHVPSLFSGLRVHYLSYTAFGGSHQ